jgi:hypothetical protein
MRRIVYAIMGFGFSEVSSKVYLIEFIIQVPKQITLPSRETRAIITNGIIARKIAIFRIISHQTGV